MPHLVTNNHAWAPQGNISVGGVHRRVGGVLASLNRWHTDMVSWKAVAIRGGLAGDVVCGCIDVYYCRQRRDPGALQLCEHPEGFNDANDASM
jgi:hypothetical protein